MKRERYVALTVPKQANGRAHSPFARFATCIYFCGCCCCCCCWRSVYFYFMIRSVQYDYMNRSDIIHIFVSVSHLVCARMIEEIYKCGALGVSEFDATQYAYRCRVVYLVSLFCAPFFLLSISIRNIKYQ